MILCLFIVQLLTPSLVYLFISVKDDSGLVYLYSIKDDSGMVYLFISVKDGGCHKKLDWGAAQHEHEHHHHHHLHYLQAAAGYINNENLLINKRVYKYIEP